MSEKEKYLGEFEQVALLALVKLGKEAYGANIRKLIHAEIKRDVAIGALYSTLDRLESKGMVVSSFGCETPKRGGRPKKYFEVTSVGKEALQKSRDAMSAMWTGVQLKSWIETLHA